jgi:Mn2+/Fe2+ NRAMP family transporter
MSQTKIDLPPKGFAILALLGPGMIWVSDLIGSGEVIITTRTGAILGTGVMWAIVIGIALKFWIGISGARYTTSTGEGMIDMFSRIPGPKNWVVWIVLVIQFVSAAFAMGALASSAGVFVSSIIPIPPQLGGWIVSLLALIVAWFGGFDLLKIITSMFVAVIILGVLYIAMTVFPGWQEFISGFYFKIPEVPDWAVAKSGVDKNPWREVLPLMGWAAGGFGSQTWYSYWILGAGYGAAKNRPFGEPANVDYLKSLSREETGKIKGWFKVVYWDSAVAFLITTTLTLAFLIAGAGILRPEQIAPEGSQVAIMLSKIFSSNWGSFGGTVFMITGSAALIGTLFVQLSGWPRLLADAFRICIPKINKSFPWKSQYRFFILFFFFTNMIIVFALGVKPVFLVKISAILDGLLLTPLQAIWVAIGLFFVLPKIFSKENYQIIKPHWIFAVLLVAAFLLFGYFCLFQIPLIL